MSNGLADAWRDRLRRRLAIDALASLDPGLVPPQHALFGRTQTEVGQLIEALRHEEDLLTLLMLFAAAEAEIQNRAKQLANSKGALPVEQSLRLLYMQKKKQKKRPRLIDDVLQTWRDHGYQVNIGDFKSIAKTRHWLAHGRYWTHAPTVTAPLAWTQLSSVLGQIGIPLVGQPTSPW